MSTELITLEEEEDIDLADEMMRLGRVRHLPVVQGSRLVGLITQRDLLRIQVSSLADLSPDESHDINRRIQARDIMNHQVRTVEPDTSVLEAAKLMRHNQYGCLPVVHKDALLGIVTEADFVQLIIDALESNEDGDAPSEPTKP